MRAEPASGKFSKESLPSKSSPASSNKEFSMAFDRNRIKQAINAEVLHTGTAGAVGISGTSWTLFFTPGFSRFSDPTGTTLPAYCRQLI